MTIADWQERAMRELPDGWAISLVMKRGEWRIELAWPDGDVLDRTLVGSVEGSMEYAIATAKLLDDGTDAP